MPIKNKYERIKDDPIRYRHYLDEKKKFTKKWNRRHTFKRFCTKIRVKYGIVINPWSLWTIAKKQRLKCALTGRKLSNDTISLDHIISVSNGGHNTDDNFQFVHVDANYAKTL